MSENKMNLLLSELVNALEKRSSLHYAEDFCKIVPGIKDGSFFRQDKKLQIKKIIWVNASYFGRGELANPLIKKGLLRKSFSNEFQKEVDNILSEKS